MEDLFTQAMIQNPSDTGLWSKLLQTIHRHFKALKIYSLSDYLPILAGIQPAELRRLGATLSLTYRGSLDPGHILHELLAGPQTATEKD